MARDDRFRLHRLAVICDGLVPVAAAADEG